MPLQRWPAQVGSQRQLPPQTCVPRLPQLRVASGEHSPWAVHADQSDHAPVSVLQERVCVPQLPHWRALSPTHIWLAHISPHWQSPRQVCMPDRPQGRVESGAQMPSAWHGPHWDHLPLAASQVRERVPQLPQLSEAGPGQAAVEHVPH